MSVTIIIALAIGLLLILAGELAGTRLPLLNKVFMPGAVLGGLLALLLGPQVFGPEKVSAFDLDGVYTIYSSWPGYFINVVFACLLLGKPLYGFKKLWHTSKRQIVMGHIFAWGQYVMGFSLILLVLGPVFDLPEIIGSAIAIGFQGGHGTAAGLSQTFQDMGFADGVTITYALATFGIVAGAIGGPLLATVLKRKYNPELKKKADSAGHEPSRKEVAEKKEDHKGGFSPLTGRLTLHFALLAIVIAIGYLISYSMVSLESSMRGIPRGETVATYVPLFSIVLLVGMATQFVLQFTKWERYFDRSVFDLISAFALDLVIFGALSTLQLSTMGEYWLPILLLCIVGLGWNLAVLLLLGPRVYEKPWYAYGLGDFGGGTATTASGVLLIRIVDPKEHTGAMRSYSGKQPFYEPFMGGGLVTALALPIAAALGAGVTLMICSAILAFWLVVALKAFSLGK